MADTGKNAITTSSGDGSTVTFPIGFEYLDEADIEVKVATVTQTINTDYTISDDGDDVVFKSTSIPASGTDNIVFTRVTPHSSLAVTLADGAPITAEDFDNLVWQGIYYTEEVEDKI